MSITWAAEPSCVGRPERRFIYASRAGGSRPAYAMASRSKADRRSMRALPGKCISPRRTASWCGVALVLILAAACGRADLPAAPFLTTPATEPSDTTTPSATETEQAVLDAYQEFWRVWLKANNPPNPDDPDLARVATGAELDTVRAAILKKQAEGTYTRLPQGSGYRHRPAISGFSGTRNATVTDCAFDDAQLVKASTGQVLNDDKATQLIIGTLSEGDGMWRVLDIDVKRQTPGDIPCATL